MLRGVAVALLLASACAADQAEVAEASQRARPHLAAFADFDRWARRARASAGVSADPRESLAETSFAPLRLESAVLGAWIEVDGGVPPLMSWPRDVVVPEGLGWVTLRDHELGVLDVGVSAPCEVVSRRRPAEPAARCILLSRVARTGAGEQMTVTVAFRAAEEEVVARTGFASTR